MAYARAALLLLACSHAGALLPTSAPLRAAIHGAPRATPLRPLRVPPIVCASDKLGPPLNPLQRLLQKLRPKLADGSPRPLPQWTRRWVVLLVKLRPVLPVLFVMMLIIMQGMRRSSGAPRPVELSYAAFMKLVEAKGGASLTDVRVSLTRISFLLDGKAAYTRPVRAPDSLIWFLHRSGVDFRAAATSAATALLPLLFPCLWLGAVYTMMRRQMGGATGSVGKKGSSLKLSADDLSFDDVAGIDSAKQEVQEIVSMLKEPGRYTAAGARLPAGVLMVGPPGTGKTLLARVMAAQADVPFFYCSGRCIISPHLPKLPTSRPHHALLSRPPLTPSSHALSHALVHVHLQRLCRALRWPRRGAHACSLQGGCRGGSVPHLRRRAGRPRQAALPPDRREQ